MSDVEPDDDAGRELDLPPPAQGVRHQARPVPGAPRAGRRDPVVANWIAEVERERRSLERELGRKPPLAGSRRPRSRRWYAQLKDIVEVLADADPEDKRAIYDELGVNLTYHPDGRVRVGAGSRVLRVRVGGGT